MHCVCLIRLNLSAGCGGKCLTLANRHPLQLSVPDVPATAANTSSGATLLVQNINTTSLLDIQDNNSMISSAFKNLSE